MATSIDPTLVYQLPLIPVADNFFTDELAALKQARRPLSTMLVANACNLNERTAYNHLRRYEALGLVTRPKGKRSGWMIPKQDARLH